MRDKEKSQLKLCYKTSTLFLYFFSCFARNLCVETANVQVNQQYTYHMWAE